MAMEEDDLVPIYKWTKKQIIRVLGMRGKRIYQARMLLLDKGRIFLNWNSCNIEDKIALTIDVTIVRDMLIRPRGNM